MALQLELIRHADARNKDPGDSDIERELSPLGQRQVLILGERLRDRGSFPDRVWCSPAARTRATLAALGYDYTSRTVDEPRLYEAELDTLLDLVAEVRQLAGHGVLIGHNPGLQDLMVFLLGPRAPAMMTCAHARLSIPDRPARPLRGSGRLLDFWAP